MSKILVVIEAPGKIAKIKSILDSLKDGNNYTVIASVGHIIDLDSNKLSVDVKNNFEPTYSINKDKHDIVKKLKAAYSKSDDVLLATDEDREGEMIAWSIASVLKLKNPKRIAYVAITKEDIGNAVKNPRKIDDALVNAQKTRRILDRIVGFEISPILWKSIGASLSAGRVQSVVTRIIIDRENEIKEFMQNKNSSYFKVLGVFLDNKNKPFDAYLHETKDYAKNDTPDAPLSGKTAAIDTYENMKKLMKQLTTTAYRTTDVSKKDSIRQPPAPFTTSTLQQESSNKLGMTVKRTMMAAQHLYEAGLITYMRTDSMFISTDATKKIKDYVSEKYGDKNYRHKAYKSKSANTQEAHEAIRPTDVNNTSVSGNKISNDEVRLYLLIWKRTLASQMAPAIFDITKIQISPITKTNNGYCFVTEIQNLKFAGYLSVYNMEEGTETKNSGIAVPGVGDMVQITEITATEEHEKPPSRYNEASLINKLDKLGIGRPSTYASILVKIQEREYVKIEDIQGMEKNSIILNWTNKSKIIQENTEKVFIGKEHSKLIPTALGNLVNSFLTKYFSDIIDYQFTANMEDELDSIAEDKSVWYEVLQKFYDKFHPIVDGISVNSKEISKELKNRHLFGKMPETNEDIYIENGRYGSYLLLCPSGTTKKCKTAPIKKPLTPENITVNDVVDIFKFPINLGKHNRKNVLIKRGMYGYYLSYGDKNVSMSNVKDIDPFKMTLEDAIKILETVGQNQIASFKDTVSGNEYTILKGPYGNYVKINAKSKLKTANKSVSLPKDLTIDDLKKLDLDKLKEIINLAYQNKKRRPFKKLKK